MVAFLASCKSGRPSAGTKAVHWTDHSSSLAGGFFILLYYLPIYFQAVRGTTATNSGIRNLSLIIADSMFPSSLPPGWGLALTPRLFLSIDSHRLRHRHHTFRLFCPVRHSRVRHHHHRLRLDLHLHHDVPQLSLDRIPGPCRLRYRILLPGPHHGGASAVSAGRCLVHHRDSAMSASPPAIDALTPL